jgi:hypothetical protein
MLDNNYTCNVPVVLIFYNRPDVTYKTFQAIRTVKPKTFILVSDGSKDNDIKDNENVLKCLEIINLIDWDCNLIKLISKENLGCLRRVITGLNYVFSIVDEAIILEDDCLPSTNFFKFMEWGLLNFKENKKVGMISGSNLISNKFDSIYLNGFSNYINIWGWSTWKDRWEKHNPYISCHNVNKTVDSFLQKNNFSFVEKLYWKELIYYSIYLGSTWDFQLQYTFFKYNLVSVYPKFNLVNNIGFGKDGTHTNINVPNYVKLNKYFEDISFLNLPPSNSIHLNVNRDFILAKTIWGLNIYSVLKLFLRNKLRIYKKFI